MIDSSTGIALVLRLSLAVVLLYAGVAKVRSPNWPSALAAYGILPRRGITLVAAWIVPLELVTGLGLLAGVALPVSAATATVLTAGFLAAVTFALARGRRIPCGCFGSDGPVIGRGALARNLLLFASALTLTVQSIALPSPATWSVIALAPPEDGAAVLAAVVFSVALIATLQEYDAVSGWRAARREGVSP